MRPLSTALPSRHGHGGTWRDDAVRQGLVSDPRAIRLVAYYPQLAPLVGGPTPALLLCQLLFWTGRQQDPEGWIHKEQAEWYAETGLSRRNQEGARKKLRARGLLEERRGDFPPCLYYRVNLEALGNAWRAAYRMPAPTSKPGPPRPPLSPVTTDPTATIAARPEPLAQTTMLLDYPTLTDMEPPSKKLPILHEGASMGDAASTPSGAAIDPTTDRSPDPSALPNPSKNLNEITLMYETAVQQGGTVHYESTKNHSNFDGIHHLARMEITTERKKKKCLRARTHNTPTASSSPDPATNKKSARAREPPAATPPPSPSPQPVKTPAPNTLSIPEDFVAWATEHAPNRNLAHECDKFLQHCRAQNISNVNWLEAFRGWLSGAYLPPQGPGHRPTPRTAAAAPIVAEDDTLQASRAEHGSHDQARDDQWREAYDRRYGTDAPRAPHTLEQTTTVPSWQQPPPAEEDRIPVDELRALVDGFLTGRSLAQPASAAAAPEHLEAQVSPTAAPQSACAQLVQTAREGSGAHRAGEVDWHARELLQEARAARHAGRLTAEQLVAFAEGTPGYGKRTRGRRGLRAAEAVSRNLTAR